MLGGLPRGARKSWLFKIGFPKDWFSKKTGFPRLGYPGDAVGLRGELMLQAAKINTGRALRVGVVGVGVMGANHARVLSEFPGVELAGVADPDRKQAHFVGGTLG